MGLIGLLGPWADSRPSGCRANLLFLVMQQTFLCDSFVIPCVLSRHYWNSAMCTVLHSSGTALISTTFVHLQCLVQGREAFQNPSSIQFTQNPSSIQFTQGSCVCFLNLNSQATASAADLSNSTFGCSEARMPRLSTGCTGLHPVRFPHVLPT